MTTWIELTLADKPVMVDAEKVMAIEPIVDSYARWGITPRLSKRDVCWLVLEGMQRIAVDGTADQVARKLAGEKEKVW